MHAVFKYILIMKHVYFYAFVFRKEKCLLLRKRNKNRYILVEWEVARKCGGNIVEELKIEENRGKN
jgi:hypothetical protein